MRERRTADGDDHEQHCTAHSTSRASSGLTSLASMRSSTCASFWRNASARARRFRSLVLTWNVARPCKQTAVHCHVSMGVAPS